MDEDELKLELEAFKYIKEHKKELIHTFADSSIYKPVSKPISLFMAGSPGAGKTGESRHVSKDVFIKAFFEAKKNVRNVKDLFDKDVQLNLLIKDYDKNEEDLKLNIAADELDGFIHDGYTESELERLLT